MSETTQPALAIAEQLVAQCEGCRLEPYADLNGIPTIGYGNTYLADGSRVTMQTAPITAAEARSLLQSTLASVAAQVEALVPPGLTANQLAALLSFAYNVGVNAFRGSTMRHLLIQGETAEAANQFGAWVYASGKREPGLVTRRQLERGVFLGTVNFDAPPTPQPAPPQESEADRLNDQEIKQLGNQALLARPTAHAHHFLL